MVELTSRETAWINSLEVPLIRCLLDGAHSAMWPRSYLANARQAVEESRRLLAEAAPDAAAWGRRLWPDA